MEIKFAPWRMAYIQQTEAPLCGGCVLCTIPQAESHHDRQNLLLYRGQTCYVVLNLYPYNTGHLMVVPYAHTNDLGNLDDACANELFSLTRRAIRCLTQVYHPHGHNLGMNLGRVAGAGIDQHLHMHIIPRWSGDTNFLPLLAEVKLVPEELDQTYGRLQSLFADV